MNSRDFEKLLRGYAALFKYTGSRQDAQLLSEFAECWSVGPNRTLSTALSLARKTLGEQSKKRLFTSKISILEAALQAGMPLIASVVTAAKLKHVKAVLDFVTVHRDMALTDFFMQLKQAFNSDTKTKAPQKQEPVTDIVRKYVERLNESLGDAKEFKAIYDQMTKDKTVKIAEAHEIALKFSGHQGKGTKKKAFERIWKKHEYYMDSSIAAKAMGGKSAA